MSTHSDFQNKSDGGARRYVYTFSAPVGGGIVLNDAVRDHVSILSSSTNAKTFARPLMYITVLPFVEPTEGSSDINHAALVQYHHIEEELDLLAAGGAENSDLEPGEIDTARAIVRQLKNRQLAPPELSWTGGEAIIMLWVLNEKKLALTVTDGEFGYTVRVPGKTLERKSNIELENFDMIRIK